MGFAKMGRGGMWLSRPSPCTCASTRDDHCGALGPKRLLRQRLPVAASSTATIYPIHPPTPPPPSIHPSLHPRTQVPRSGPKSCVAGSCCEDGPGAAHARHSTTTTTTTSVRSGSHAHLAARLECTYCKNRPPPPGCYPPRLQSAKLAAVSRLRPSSSSRAQSGIIAGLTNIANA